MKIVKFLLLIMCAFAVMLLPKSLRAQQIVYPIDFDQTLFSIDTVAYGDSTYYSLNYEGLTEYGNPGEPLILCKYVTFSVPFDAKDISVNSSAKYPPIRTSLDHLVVPHQEPLTTDGESADGYTLPIDSIYYGTNPFPNFRVKIVNEGFYMGNQHLITVCVCPIIYYPNHKFVSFYRNINVRISYSTNGSSYGGGLVPSPTYNIVNAQEIADEVKEMVVNPQQVQVTASGPDVNPAPVLTNNAPTFDYTIITSRELEPAFKKIIALKRQKGYSAGVVTTEDIVSDSIFSLGDQVSNIADSAGMIRAYLHHSFANGGHRNHFLLLGGKNPHVPFRYSSTLFKSLNTNELTPTDAYYSDLNTCWKWDGVSAYANAGDMDYGRDFDFYPEFYVGRLLCNQTDEIENYTDKLLRYEFNPGNGDYSYLKRVFYSQCDWMVKDKQAQEVHGHILFETDSTLIEQQSAAYPTGSDVISELQSTKYGILNFQGHGGPSGISVNYTKYHTKGVLAVHEFGGYLPIEANNSIEYLENKDYPSIIYSTSCKTNPFDIYTNNVNFTYNGRYNMGESFTLGKDYGGIAFIGNTRDGYRNVSIDIQKSFYDIISSKEKKLGIAEAKSKIKSKKWFIGATPYHVALTHNLIGDPEVEMWTDVPGSISSYNVVRNNSGIQVSGSLPDSCIVAYCDNDGNQGMYTYTGGTLNLAGVSPNSCIMLYKHNYLPTIAPLAIQNETIINSQYMFASTLAIGKNVDSGRTQGNVTISSGAEYEVEATGDVLLGDGLVVEDGATLRIWTPGTVTISGGTIKNGATVEVFANEMVTNGAFNCELGSNVKIDNYSPLR